MRLVGNIGKIVDKTGGKSGEGGSRGVNRVIEFGLFSDREGKSSYKIRRWIVFF